MDLLSGYLLFGVRRLSRTPVFVCAVIVSTCAQPSGPDPVEGEIPTERLASEWTSGFEEADRRVIHNPIEWAIVWAKIYENRSPKPPLPSINFSKEQVIVAALGSQPSSGYSISITGATRTVGSITVRVERRSPGSGCGGLTVITHPVDVVKMPRTVGPVVFEETAIVRNCG